MYLDPSFGGMLLQAIVALAAAGGVIVFGMRKKIKALFKKNIDVTATNINQQAPHVDGEVVDMLAEEDSDSK